MLIFPKNWTEFQHYKDRRPPWIKLYRTLLDDAEFHCLPDASKALAIMLWLLASEGDSGSINADNKVLAFRLRTTPQKIAAALKPLMQSGFFVASTAIAERLQDAIPETERETETYKQETDTRCALPDWLDVEKWTAYLKTRAAKQRQPESLKAILAKLEKFRTDGHDPNAIIAETLANGWQGLFAPKGNGKGNGNGKFHPNAGFRERLQRSIAAEGLDGRPVSKTVDDVHGEVQPVLPGPGDD